MGRRFLSLFSKILDIILEDELHKDIGLKRGEEEGLDSLGIRAKKVELVFPPIFIFQKTKQVIFKGNFVMSIQNE